MVTANMSVHCNAGDNLDHLMLHISSEVLENAFKFNLVSNGCFGAVYRVPHDGVLCAAKDQCFDEDIYEVKYFQQECLLHGKLRHPNIVRMLGVCYHINSLDQPIKIMELLEQKISSVLSPALPKYVKLALMQDISRGLDYLHTCNPPIVHSCLTMEVIFLTANLVAKIGGFTFSVEMRPETIRLPEPTTSVSEEILLKSSLYCGLPFDIHSIGCIICEIISGKHFYGHKFYHNPIGKGFTVHSIFIGKLENYKNRIKDAPLKQLVTDCTNDNPHHCPSASLVTKIITNVIKDCYAEDNGVKMAYMMAMKEGLAESRDLQVLLVGAENTGKTCSISSFLGEEFVEGQSSTKGVETEVCKIYCKEWTKMSHSDKENDLHNGFVTQCKYDAIKKMSPKIIRQSRDSSSTSTPISKVVITPPTQDKVLSDIYTQEIIQNAPSKATQYDPESLNVTLWDFAGQTIFHNTHSVFISEEGVPIITFDASVELTNEINHRDASPPLHEKSTGISSIHYWLQVVDNMCSVEGGKGDLSPLLPTALLAGTHIDRLHPDIKEARKIAKKKILPVLEKELSEKPYAQHLAGSGKGLMAALKQFCFFISNKFRDEEIERLKNSAVKASTSLRKKQPIFFLKIERALLSHGEQVISKSMLLEIIAQSTFPLAENCEEFESILRYFHNKRTILHFSQVKSLQEIVILSPRWLAKLFSYVITAHTYVTMASDLDKAWKRLTKHGILQENLLEHMLKKFYSDYPSAISISYQQVVDILLWFHLIARITKEAWFCEEGCPSLPGHGDVFIVPSLVPRDTTKIPPITEQERMIYFVFENGFVPVSLLNQLIADCICHNIQRKNRLLWLRYSKVGLQLGSHQKYYISHCEEKKSIQLTITTVGDDVDSVQERKELIVDVTRLLDDMMKVFMPAAKRPILFVPCPLCPTLHVLLSDVCSCDTIFCPHSNDTALPTGYYSDLSTGDLSVMSTIPSTSTNQAASSTAERKLEVFTDYYSKLMRVLPIKTLTSHLVTKRIISFEEEEEIEQALLQPQTSLQSQASLQSRSTRLVLKKIANSLQAGLAYSFDELLLIMEQYGNIILYIILCGTG